jgi:hypothetical protein
MKNFCFTISFLGAVYLAITATGALSMTDSYTKCANAAKAMGQAEFNMQWGTITWDDKRKADALVNAECGAAEAKGKIVTSIFK